MPISYVSGKLPHITFSRAAAQYVGAPSVRVFACVSLRIASAEGFTAAGDSSGIALEPQTTRYSPYHGDVVKKQTNAY